MTKKKAKSPTNTRVVRYSNLTTISQPPKIGRPREWTEKDIEVERIALEEWIENPKNYFFNAFLNERKLFLEQVERFCNYSEAFRSTCARARAIQEQRIVEGAMTRKFDSTFAKFVLQNKAGWKEKAEISGDAANPLAVIMDRIALSAKDPLDDYADE